MAITNLDTMVNKATFRAIENPMFAKTSPWDYVKFQENEVRSNVIMVKSMWTEIGDVTTLSLPERVAFEAADAVADNIDDIVSVMKCIWPRLGMRAQRFVGIRVNSETLTAKAKTISVKLKDDLSYAVIYTEDDKSGMRVTISACIQALKSRIAPRFNGADRRALLRIATKYDDYHRIVNRLNDILGIHGWGMFEPGYSQALEDFCGKILFAAYYNAVLSASDGRWTHRIPTPANVDEVIDIARKLIAEADGATYEERVTAAILRRGGKASK